MVGITRSKPPVRVLPIPTSITAIPRREPTRLQLPNRMRRPLAGAYGTAVLRPNDVSPKLIRQGAYAQRSRCVTRPKYNAFVVEPSNAGLADHHNRVRRTANRHSWVSKADQVFAGF